MTGRGRPRHPDILTPREWEVLELVREGLTNEQIAERLGISRDGVKYHVSEILSKLGLSSRQEAAAWQPERRPWWAVAPAFLGWTLKQLSLPTAAKVAGGVAVVAVAGGVGVLVWAVVATGGPAGEDRELTLADLSDLTLEEAYARIEEAITRPGFVLHSTIEAMGPDDAGEMTPYYTKEFWIDADLRTLREEFRLDPGRDSYDIAEEGLAIVAGDYIYLPDDPGEALRFEVEHFCPGSRDAILSRLLECGESQVSGPLPELLETRIEPGQEYEGRPAFAIVFEWETADDAATTFRLYVDRDSSLPIARVIEWRQQGALRGEMVSVYDHEFVPADTLPPDLFDPRSIGYGAEDEDALLEEIARDVPVYWLGSEFEPGNGLEPLVLDRILVDGELGMSGWLIYSTPRGVPGINVLLWRPADWEAFMQSEAGRFLTDPRCAERREIDVSGTQAVVYVLPELRYPLSAAFLAGPCAGRIQYTPLTDTPLIAFVDLVDVVVDVRTDVVGSHDSLQALEAVVNGLRPR